MTPNVLFRQQPYVCQRHANFLHGFHFEYRDSFSAGSLGFARPDIVAAASFQI